MEAARGELERSHELFDAAGSTREAAFVLRLLGNVDWQLHDPERGMERLSSAYAVLVEGVHDDGFAAVAAELGRLQFFVGELDKAQETIDAALDVAERLWQPEILSQALNTAGLIAANRGRWEQ